MAIARDKLQVQLKETSAELILNPNDGLRFDWLVTILSGWMVGGIFLDGWAHNHGKVDSSFFTIWHAILYSGFFALTTLLSLKLISNHAAGASWRSAMPRGYNLSLIGAAIFMVAGLGDMVWHILLGIEVSVEAIMSPTHLGLALGGILMISGPARAAWLRLSDGTPGLKQLFPALLSLAMLLAALSFFTQFAHPLVDVFATSTTTASAASQKTRSELYSMRADGRFQTRLFNDSTKSYGQASFSADGKKIAYFAGADHQTDIYIMNLDGSNELRLTNNPSDNYFPSWSPDGKRIAFVSTRDDNPELYVMNTDGSNQTRLTNNKGFDGVASWSPDSSKIVFQSERDGKYNIFVMNADGTNLANLTQNQGESHHPAWSPDGRFIAFNSDRDGTGQGEIYLMNADGSNQLRLTNGATGKYYPAWSPDSKRLLYVSWRKDNADIYLMNLDGSGQTNLTNNPALNNVQSVSWSPDGSTIIYSSVITAGGVADYFRDALGITSILLFAALFMGFVLLAMRRWTLPFGAVTLIFTVNGLLVSVLKDQERLIFVSVLAGLIADLLIQRLQPSVSRVVALRLVAFVVPVVFYSLYFLALLLTSNSFVWTIPLWSGAIVMAGVVGLLLSYLVVLPKQPDPAS